MPFSFTKRSTSSGVWEEDFYFAFVFGIVHREKLVMLIEESPCIKGENFYRDIVFEDSICDDLTAGT